MTSVAPLTANDASYVSRLNLESHFSGRHASPGAPHIVNHFSSVTPINDESHFAPRIVNNVSYVTKINHECYFVLQSSTE